MLAIHLFPCLSDNYGYLVHDGDAGVTAAVDTPDAEAVQAALGERGWRLDCILNTHHHWDHTGGNLALKQATGCRVYGPAAEDGRIPGLDHALQDGERFDFGGHAVEVLHTPGHTRGHVVYHFPAEAVVFTGDTLFSLGCGRLFEGTAAEMWNSLQRLRQLPPATRVYCGHEYTLANAGFALQVEADNAALRRHAEQARAQRQRQQPTLPSCIALERQANPFLRADEADVQRAVGMEGADAVAVFAELRRRKDNYVPGPP